MCYDKASDGPTAGTEFKGYTPYAQPGESEPQYRARREAEQHKQASAAKAVHYSTITVTELRRRRDELQLLRDGLDQKIEVLRQLINLWENF
jgi:DNA-binding XRE family transcriptional regulator